MAISRRSGSSGWTRTVWRHIPPPPGCHSGRCGWSHNPLTNEKLRPPSSLRNSAAGSTPAYITSGSLTGPGASCQILASDASALSGKRNAACSSSVHVVPRSSERRSTGPQWLLTDPVNSRVVPDRESMQVEYTSSPGNVGPLNSKPARSSPARRVNNPFAVPTSTIASVVAVAPGAPDEVVDVMRLLTSLGPQTHRCQSALPHHRSHLSDRVHRGAPNWADS